MFVRIFHVPRFGFFRNWVQIDPKLEIKGLLVTQSYFQLLTVRSTRAHPNSKDELAGVRSIVSV